MFQLLALLVAATPPVFRADAQALFRGCHAEAEGPAGRYYGCQGWDASIAVIPNSEKLDDDQVWGVLELSARAIVKGVGTKATTHDESVGGKTVSVHRQVPTRPSTWAFIDMAFVREPSQRVRAATCSAAVSSEDSLHRCRTVLQYLLSHGAPENIDLGTLPQPSLPIILGRRLTVPAECSLPMSSPELGNIQCAEASFAWNLIPSLLAPDSVVDEMVLMAAKTQGLTPSSEHFDCLVENRAARCATATKPGSPLQMRAGAIQVEGNTLVVTCTSAVPNDPSPPACNGVIALKAPGHDTPADGGSRERK